MANRSDFSDVMGAGYSRQPFSGQGSIVQRLGSARKAGTDQTGQTGQTGQTVASQSAPVPGALVGQPAVRPMQQYTPPSIYESGYAGDIQRSQNTLDSEFANQQKRLGSVSNPQSGYMGNPNMRYAVKDYLRDVGGALQEQGLPSNFDPRYQSR